MKKILILVCVFALILGVFAVSSAEVKYGGTLKVSGGVGAGVFNPFVSATAESITSSIYEGLFYINKLNGKVTPLLGTSYEWRNNNLDLVITIRKEVEWSDGISFTPKDVVFTFNYVKKYPGLDISGVWTPISCLQSVKAEGDTVVFKFSKQNTPVLASISAIPIVPEHIWSKIEDPTKFENKEPVGTGPLLFKDISQSAGVLTAVKNPNFWMKGRPYIDGLKIIKALGNVTAVMMLLKDEVDWAYLYIPSVKETWNDKNPETNKSWWPVVNANVLYLNTQKYPFTIPEFRKALAMAIDKEALELKAYYGIGGVANPTGIIPTQEEEWLDPSLKSVMYTYSPQKAQELLASIGFEKNSSGDLVYPGGKVLPTFKILVGSGWTDYITMAQIISENFKELGINTVIDQEQWGAYISSLMTGTYDTAICWETGDGPTPYYLYFNEFNPAFSATKIGEKASSDYSRYTNPLITSALQVFAQTSDLRLQKQAIYTIERIVLDDVPFVPLTNRTNFMNYSEKNFVGWPSDSDPYTSGEGVNQAGGEMVVINVHLK